MDNILSAPYEVNLSLDILSPMQENIPSLCCVMVVLDFFHNHLHTLLKSIPVDLLLSHCLIMFKIQLFIIGSVCLGLKFELKLSIVQHHLYPHTFLLSFVLHNVLYPSAQYTFSQLECVFTSSLSNLLKKSLLLFLKLHNLFPLFKASSFIDIVVSSKGI